MTTDQRIAINKQNAQLSTGPKTPEGKQKVSQNALIHGLSSQTLPLSNPHFQELLAGFIEEHKPQSPTALSLVEEIALIAWKIRQIPALEYEIQLNSELTLAQHFMQDKPTPLTRLWNLGLRLGGRFNTLLSKLQSLKEEGHCSPAQNKPNSDVNVHVDKSSAGTPKKDNTPPRPQNPVLQIKPTPSTFSLQPSAPLVQNKPAPTLSKLAKAIAQVNLNIPNPF